MLHRNGEPRYRHGARRRQAGFSVVELLVSLTVLLFCVTGFAGMMTENSRINRSQQMTAEVQSSARNCMEMIVQRIRSAGWDPMNAGLETLVLDTNPGDDISELEIFADLDEDGLTDGVDEQILIRHSDGRVFWRLTNDEDDPFILLATNISNDADGDGTLEPMFTPFPAVDPTMITVTITATSPQPSPVSGEFVRYTIASDVILRKSL